MRLRPPLQVRVLGFVVHFDAAKLPDTPPLHERRLVKGRAKAVLRPSKGRKTPLRLPVVRLFVLLLYLLRLLLLPKAVRLASTRKFLQVVVVAVAPPVVARRRLRVLAVRAPVRAKQPFGKVVAPLPRLYRVRVGVRRLMRQRVYVVGVQHDGVRLAPLLLRVGLRLPPLLVAERARLREVGRRLVAPATRVVAVALRLIGRVPPVAGQRPTPKPLRLLKAVAPQLLPYPHLDGLPFHMAVAPPALVGRQL